DTDRPSLALVQLLSTQNWRSSPPIQRCIPVLGTTAPPKFATELSRPGWTLGWWKKQCKPISIAVQNQSRIPSRKATGSSGDQQSDDRQVVAAITAPK
ncbi:hypothetical protein L917_20663, partial [Phytophthora nicotianae]